MNAQQTPALVRYVEGVIDRLERMVSFLDDDGEPVHKKNARSELDVLRRRLLEALRRDLVGDVLPDGEARRRGPSPAGGRGGGATVLVEDESGAFVSVPVTGVEATVIARVEGRAPNDVHHEHVAAAIALVEQAVRSIDAANGRLDLIDAIAGGADLPTGPSGFCLVCTKYVPGTSENRLRRGMCDADYRAWKRAGRPELTDFVRLRQAEEADDQSTDPQEEQVHNNPDTAVHRDDVATRAEEHAELADDGAPCEVNQ